MIEFNQLAEMPIIDSHVHFIHPECKDEMLSLFDQFGYRAANLVCLPNLDGTTQNQIALNFKKEFPEKVFISGAIEYDKLLNQPDQFAEDLPRQVQELIKQGFDGMKMIEGKPSVRKLVNLTLDDPVYDGLWRTLEQEQLPLVLHVADPDFFWDKQRCPDWAKKSGWDYTDGTYPNKIDLFTEVDHVLERFPNLLLTLAHFKFMSTELSAAADFLSTHPTVNFDLAPHLDMYTDFSENVSETREFFLAFSDQILYGTDLDTRVLKRGPEGRSLVTSIAFLIRQFLEVDGPFDVANGKKYHGLHLPEDILHKIYHLNFERIYSKSALTVNYPKLIGL
jgi:predicted TIM-barrel fold metal-dependent hydrolase